MNNAPKQQKLKSFPQLIYKSPIFLLLLFWLSLVAIAALGLVGLIYPGWQSTENQPTFNIAAKEEIAEKEVKLPLWFFLGIFLGCSGGSLLMTYAIKYLTICWQENQLATAEQVKQPKIPHQLPQKSLAKIPSTVNFRQQTQAIPVKIEEEPIITIVSPQESISLEKQEPTLAETMDLRKRRSLASLLRNH